MNKQQQIAAAWLPLIQAAAEGKTIQCLCFSDDLQNRVWRDFRLPDELIMVMERMGLDSFRIKPEPKKGWYRVALLKSSCGHVWTDTFEGGTEQIEKESQFVRWLTDRIEYELPEGE